MTEKLAILRVKDRQVFTFYALQRQRLYIVPTPSSKVISTTINFINFIICEYLEKLMSNNNSTISYNLN